jgi:chorismate mutase
VAQHRPDKLTNRRPSSAPRKASGKARSQRPEAAKRPQNRAGASRAARPGTQLDAAREAIAARRRLMDALNLRLLELVERRTRLARRIGRAKAAAGLAASDPARERAMLDALLEAASGELPRRDLERIFRSVFRASRAAVLRDRRR